MLSLLLLPVATTSRQAQRRSRPGSGHHPPPKLAPQRPPNDRGRPDGALPSAGPVQTASHPRPSNQAFILCFSPAPLADPPRRWPGGSSGGLCETRRRPYSATTAIVTARSIAALRSALTLASTAAGGPKIAPEGLPGVRVGNRYARAAPEDRWAAQHPAQGGQAHSRAGRRLPPCARLPRRPERAGRGSSSLFPSG